MLTNHKKGQKPPPDELTAEKIMAELCEMSGMTKDEVIQKAKELNELLHKNPRSDKAKVTEKRKSS